MDRLTKERLKVYFGTTRAWTRHSLVLLVAGLSYVGIGLAYATTPPAPDRTVALEVLLDFMPLSSWGYVFMSVGLLTVISSKWPPISEKWGYAILTGLSAAWSSGYLLSMLVGASPIQNATGFLVWALVAFLWWAISGLNNPTKPVVDGRS